MSSNSQKNITVIKDWLDAHNRDDIEGELALWDDHAEMSVIPTGKTYSGIDELRAAAEMAVKVQGRKTLNHIFADDEWVCAEYTSVAHVEGPLDINNIQIPASVSKDVTNIICFLANVKDGKIAHAREYWDTGAMTRQMNELQAGTLK